MMTTNERRKLAELCGLEIKKRTHFMKDDYYSHIGIEDYVVPFRLFNPYTSIEQAMMVVEALRSQYEVWLFIIDKDWCCNIIKKPVGVNHIKSAATLSLAICGAALEAIKETK